MIPLWSFLTSRIGRLVAGIAALLAVIGAARWDARRDQRRETETQQARDALEAKETRDEVEDDVARTGADDVRKRLRERWRRD